METAKISDQISNSPIFVSHKKVKHLAMSRADYNIYRGWDLPEDENGEDEGYLVEYLDGGEGNHPDHNGYISWTPKKQFDDGYTKLCEQPLSWNKGIAYLVDGKEFSTGKDEGSKRLFIIQQDGNKFSFRKEEIPTPDQPKAKGPMIDFICVKVCTYGGRQWVPEENKVLQAVEAPSKCFVAVNEAKNAGIEIDPEELQKVQISAVLMKFDTSDDKFWTNGGLPAMDVLIEMLGFEVTRKVVEKAFPGFNRDSDIKPLYKKKISIVE